MVEPLRQPIDDGAFQPVVMQNGRINKRRQLRFAPDDVLGLTADPRPDRIDLIEQRLRLLLGHVDVLPERPVLEYASSRTRAF